MCYELFNGDCLKILPKIPDSSIDLIFCDLPYGVTECHWDRILPMEELWPEYLRIAKVNAPMILTGCQPFTTYLINSNPKIFRYELIWYKTKTSGFLSAKVKPISSHENILFFYRKKPAYFPVKYEVSAKYIRKGKMKGNAGRGTVFNIRGEKSENYQYLDDGTRYPDSVLCFPSEHERGMHPTQKPVSLLRFLLKSYSKKGDTILDNCMGFGSTGIAALELDRNFIGIEKDKAYFDKAEARLSMAEKRMNLGLNFEE